MAALQIADHTPQGILSQAAFQGDLDQVCELLENGENYRLWDEFGWTPLHWAVFGGHLSVVGQLLKHHAECGQPESEFHKMSDEQIKSYTNAPPPIILAAELQKIDKNAVEIFCELLQHLEIPEGKLLGAKFNMMWKQGTFDTGSSRFSANMWRVIGKEERHNGLESSIPRAGGHGKNNLNSRREDFTEWKSVLLLCAIRDSQWKVMQMLIRAGADVNFEHALHEAAFRSDPRYVECLMDHGADIKCATIGGRTALHEAVMNGFLDTIIALVERGADVNLQQAREYGESSVHMDSRLTTKNFDFWFTRKGASTLMQACGFLLGRNDKFRRIHAVDPTRTPEEKTMEIVRFLLSKGADPTLNDSLGMTALHFAVLQPHVPLVKVLIEAGASVDALDCKGRTPLHYLARCDENVDENDLEEVIRLLCKTGEVEISQTLLNQPVFRPSQPSEDQKNNVRSLMITKTTRDGFGVSFDSVEDDSHTPLAVSLLSSRWKVVDILTRLGATLPTNIDLQTVLLTALKDLEVNIVDILLQNGVKAPACSLMALIRAFIDHKTKQDPADDLDSRLRSILRAIIPAEADVNFCESDQPSSDADEDAEAAGDEKEDKKSDDEDSDSEGSEEECESSEEDDEYVKDGPNILTPLNLVASIRGSRTILEDLLLFGADVYAVSSHGFDPILNAAVYGDSQDLELLLDHALSHPSDSHWSRSLGNIPKEGDPAVRVCRCLKEAGALDRTNSQGRTLLHLAAEQGNENLLASLLLHGARIDVLDNQRTRAIQCAAKSRHAHAFEALLMAEYNTSSNSQRQSEFGQSKCKTDIALLNPKTSPQVISVLLRYAPNYILDRYLGLNIFPTVYGAIKYGNMELLSTLLNHNADIEAADIYGWRPLHVACYQGRTSMVEALIAKGADVHCPTQAWNDRDDKPSGLYLSESWAGTPLHLAAMGAHLDIVRILLGLGVDVHASTKTGKMKFTYLSPGHGPTALHLALDTNIHYRRQGQVLSEDRLRIAQLLANAGARAPGIVNQMNLEQRARFHEFPDLWEALIARETAPNENEDDGQA